jgi:hypothetical protein
MRSAALTLVLAIIVLAEDTSVRPGLWPYGKLLRNAPGRHAKVGSTALPHLRAGQGGDCEAALTGLALCVPPLDSFDYSEFCACAAPFHTVLRACDDDGVLFLNTDILCSPCGNATYGVSLQEECLLEGNGCSDACQPLLCTFLSECPEGGPPNITIPEELHHAYEEAREEATNATALCPCEM